MKRLSSRLIVEYSHGTTSKFSVTYEPVGVYRTKGFRITGQVSPSTRNSSSRVARRLFPRILSTLDGAWNMAIDCQSFSKSLSSIHKRVKEWSTLDQGVNHLIQYQYRLLLINPPNPYTSFLTKNPERYDNGLHPKFSSNSTAPQPLSFLATSLNSAPKSLSMQQSPKK